MPLTIVGGREDRIAISYAGVVDPLVFEADINALLAEQASVQLSDTRSLEWNGLKCKGLVAHSSLLKRAGDGVILDAHHHLWKYKPAEYRWLDGPMHALQRDFLVEDLAREAAGAGVRGTVAVQARQSLEETRWLLEVADSSALIRGVVGWAPIADPGFRQVMDEFAGSAKLKGLRHVIQDEPQDDFILGQQFNDGIDALRSMDLAFDVLVFARHLPQTIAFADRHSDQPLVLDHVAKPAIAQDLSNSYLFEQWAANMRELGRRSNVWCKLSGMVTEAKWDSWSLDILRPYLDVAVEAFGPERLLVGSDWPVCLVATKYLDWFQLLRDYFAEFSEDERSLIFSGNAVDVYSLEVGESDSRGERPAPGAVSALSRESGDGGAKPG